MAKKKRSCYDPYYMKKADDWLSLLVRMQAGCCSICGRRGDYSKTWQIYIDGLEAHHNLPKSVYLNLRYEPMNMICLCIRHHTGQYLIPHDKADYIFAEMEPEYAILTQEFDKAQGRVITTYNKQIIVPNAYDRFLQAEENDKWTWREANKENKIDITTKINFQEIAKTLEAEFKETLKTNWLDNPQIDPKQLKGAVKRVD